jgi:uncharacterized protein with PIN domain
MPVATFFFNDELGDFLAASRRGQECRMQFEGKQSVKHLIESLGVPHTEVGQIIGREREVGFGHIPQDGESFSIYPAKDVPPDPRFLLDNHLGKLATYLRILGLDAVYQNNFQDDDLVAILQEDARILLTRDRRLLMRKAVRTGYWLRSTNPEIQAREVVQRFQLTGRIKPFHRCLRCNTALEAIPKAAVVNRLEPLTQRYYHEFYVCPSCDRLFWKGSHHEHMQGLIGRIVEPSWLNG